MSKPYEGLFFFVGELNPETIKLKEMLSRHKKHVFKTESSDEIDQGARQSGKTILIFSDPKFAMKFLSDNKWPGLSFMNVLVIDKDGFFKPDVMDKFQQLRLRLYSPKSIPAMVEDVRKYLSGEEKDNGPDDIQFSVNIQVKGK